MKNTTLKQGIFFRADNRDIQFERYIVETHEDLEKFFNAFPINRSLMQKNMINDLAQGYIILFNDINRVGFNSYCFETKLKGRTIEDLHPSDFIRVPEIVGDCPLCNCVLTELIEDSEEIRACDGCGAEWEQSSGTITLDPKEL